MVATMAGFIAAPEIAILAEPLYLWRIRQDGTSITQDHDRWRNQLDRFTELRRLACLLRAADLGETKRWLDWKVASLDLAYTQLALLALEDRAAEVLLDETNGLLDDLDLDPSIPLNPDVGVRLAGIRTGDLDACRQALARAPIRPDRHCVALDREPDEVLRLSLVGVAARDGELIIDVKAPRRRVDAVLVGSSPAPLAGGDRVWRTPMDRKAPGWFQARLSGEVIVATTGETHLHVAGTVDGRAASGELERSDWQRGQSLVFGAARLIRGHVTMSTFFEDAQLHIWGSEPDPALVGLADGGGIIELTVRSGNAKLPGILTLAAIDRDHRLDVSPSHQADGSATFRVPKRALLSRAAYAMACLADSTDPVPVPLELSATKPGERWLGSRHYRVDIGERGQAILRPPVTESITSAGSDLLRRFCAAARWSGQRSGFGGRFRR
jgi:hypothetical protein